MWRRGYLLFGTLVLLGYALTAWEGWEPFSRRYQGVPGIVAAGGGGGPSGRAPGGSQSSHAGPSGYGGGK